MSSPPSEAGSTVGAARRWLARLLSDRLPEGQREAAPLDARLIVALAAGLDPADVLLHGERPLSEAEGARVGVLAERRLAGEPTARLIGRKDFWSLSLALSPATLVPRPDTETVVTAGLAAVKGREAEPLRILDLGTGSGAILLALLSELPRSLGVGTDISTAALRTAAANATENGLAERAAFVCGDWAAAIRGRFDLVVANPPYVSSATIEGLAAEVRLYDPRRALDGGADGLSAYRRLLPDLPRLFSPGGAGILEIGADQGEALVEMARRHHMHGTPSCDLTGLPRVVTLSLTASGGAEKVLGNVALSG